MSLGQVELSGDEAHHAATVLRLRTGEDVTLFDGRGREGPAVITRAQRRCFLADVSEIRELPFELAVRVTLAFAVPKGQRQGWMVEKCTELGVAALWPTRTERGVVMASPAGLEKWRRRAIEAAKQSGRVWVPPIEPSESLSNILARCREFDQVFMALPSPDSRGLIEQVSTNHLPRAILIFIGPEGGWSDEEVTLAHANGVQPVSLGPNVLRIETAAVAACALAAQFGSACRTNAVGG